MNVAKELSWHKDFKKTSALRNEELASLRKFLGGRQPFSIYLNAAIQDLDAGIDNRWFHINSPSGIVMAIEFDDITIFSVIGEPEQRLLAAIAGNPRRTEFHALSEHAEQISKIAGNRICRRAELVYYLLEQRSHFNTNGFDMRLLTPDDVQTVESFYADHYPQTIFSTWMLERPFVGLFNDNNLVSAGGTIVLDRRDNAANIGNFLTAPEFRGKGYSKQVLKCLINHLLDQGINTFSLGTTAENIPACRAYESVGFIQIEKRIELEMTAIT
jgi:RimJ/RimL family protein N-acetyltransferase